MIKTKDSEHKQTLVSNRIINVLKGNPDGPTVVFFGGVHGNEPAGVQAIGKAFGTIQNSGQTVQGTVYGIAGNLTALGRGIRYQTEDLNRIWNPDRIEEIKKAKAISLQDEEQELREIYEQLQFILNHNSPPFYFIDIHTTSSPTSPFIVMNDSLLNRRFTNHYPLPKVLGIEEYLHGALLSFINEMGYVSFGFESGQHDDPVAVDHTIFFINYTLGLIGSLKETEKWIAEQRKELAKTSTIPTTFFEITYEHHLTASDEFEMHPGFVNFQKVRKGIAIAKYNGTVVKTAGQKRLFMPLYQRQGSEGFYYIRPINRFFLWLSKQLRTYNFDNLMTWLPGITWQNQERQTLLIDTRVARYLAKSLFHLLGYRVRNVGSNKLALKSREAASKDSEYPSSW